MTAKEYLSSYGILTAEIEQLKMEQAKEATKKREKEIAAKIAAKDEIIAIIHSLNDCVFEKIIYKYFVEQKRPAKIAREINYSVPHTRRKLKEAIAAVDRLLNS